MKQKIWYAIVITIIKDNLKVPWVSLLSMSVAFSSYTHFFFSTM